MATVLGIDTSAYTASVAVVADDGVIFDRRVVMEMPMGARGSRPQSAVLAHVRALPSLVGEALNRLGESSLTALSVSVRPRPEEASYLPPFEVGLAVAQTLAHTLRVPLVYTNHQAGHIRAGIAGADGPYGEMFYAVHISGGTTDLVLCNWNAGLGEITALGGSDDLYGGQFIDRVGVALGGPFPAGPYLERLAREEKSYPAIPVGPPRFHDGRWWISFSGPESEAMRRIARGDSGPALAAAVESAMAEAISALLGKFPPRPVLLVGGVASNLRIRTLLADRLSSSQGWRFFFAPPTWCRDNAIGVAWIGWDHIAKQS